MLSTYEKIEGYVLETERLVLREMTDEDFPALCRILQDEKTMYAYEGAFSDEEAKNWLNRMKERYANDGFGLWAVVLRESGEMIGQCGITMQNVEGTMEPEIGYLFQRAFWHHGYAAEAAIGCREYAFRTLGLPGICSIIRDTNIASQNVAKRNGMTVKEQFVKHYRGVDMPHYVFRISREEWEKTGMENV